MIVHSWRPWAADCLGHYRLSKRYNGVLMTQKTTAQKTTARRTTEQKTEPRKFDIVLFGATGFTGALTAEYLAEHGGPQLRWALAGRDESKLEALAQRLAALGSDTPEPELMQAQLNDPASLEAMAADTRVVVTTVGPYARYGEPVVAACVAGETDYLDITGEPEFVDRIRRTYGATAESKGLRLVSCCGFDSIPHDFGALFTARQLPNDQPIRIEGIVSAKGTLSGGTWQSAVEAMAGMGRRKKGPRGERKERQQESDRKVRPLRTRVRYESKVKGWICPMPTIDPVIVLRSARDLEDFGSDFRYGHSMRIGSLPKLMAGGAMLGSIFTMAQLPPTRKLLLRMRTSGEGPDAETRAKSSFRVTFLGRAGDHRVVTEVRGGDPGYGETSKMLAESALCLAFDRDQLPTRFGHLTPAAGLGDPLLERLQAAGIEFEVVETQGK